MRSRLPECVLFACALALPSPSFGGTSVGVQVNVGTAPPPVLVYHTEPRTVVVPGSAVYIVRDDSQDFDVFRYNLYWYAWRQDRWYRARSHRGPFARIELEAVPRAVLKVPAKHWKHHPHDGPPGQLKKGRMAMKDKGGHGRGR